MLTKLINRYIRPYGSLLAGVLVFQLIATAALLGSDPVPACQVTAERVGDGWRLRLWWDGVPVDLDFLYDREAEAPVESTGANRVAPALR